MSHLFRIHLTEEDGGEATIEKARKKTRITLSVVVQLHGARFDDNQVGSDQRETLFWRYRCPLYSHGEQRRPNPHIMSTDTAAAISLGVNIQSLPLPTTCLHHHPWLWLMCVWRRRVWNMCVCLRMKMTSYDACIDSLLCCLTIWRTNEWCWCTAAHPYYNTLHFPLRHGISHLLILWLASYYSVFDHHGATFPASVPW